MSDKKNIAKATLVITVFAVLGKATGIVREMIIAAYYGTTYLTDAFFIGISGPEFLRAILVGTSLNAVFIPAFTRYLKENSQAEVQGILNNVFTAVLFALIGVTILGIPLTPALVRAIAPELDPQTFALAVKITRIVFPAIIFAGLASFFGNVLNVYRHFLVPSLEQALLNVVIFIAVIFAGARYGVEALAFGFLAGSLLQLAVMVPVLRKYHVSCRPHFTVTPELRELFRAWIPVFVLSVIGSVNDLASRSLAAGLEPGNIAAVNYANRVRETIWLLCAVPLSTAVFPFMSHSTAEKDHGRLTDLTVFALRLTAFIALPLCAIMLVFSTPIIQTLFERGLFNQYSTSITSYALTFYSLGAVFYALSFVAMRVFFSLNNVGAVLKAMVLAFIVNIAAGLLFRGYLSVGGITFARSISDGVMFLVLAAGLIKLLPGLNGRKLGGYLLKMSGLAAAGAYIGYQFFAHINFGASFAARLTGLSLSLAIAVLCYAGLAAVFKVEEIVKLKELIVKKVRT